MNTIAYLILVGVVLAMLGGCSTVKYTGQDGTTVSYTRFLRGQTESK
jgi:hypothetical protein